ncbi:hypothetical protein Ancab_014016 [Ancistrocladus abbreviatus]
MSPPQSHFLLVSFPIQSHINPALQIAKRFLRVSPSVTLAVAVSAYRRMSKDTFPDGITIATISDGYDDGYDKNNDADVNDYISKFKHYGSMTLAKLIEDSAQEGRPVTCVIHTLLLPWAGEVARGFNIPSALLWIQPAALLDIYYYYFHGYGDTIRESESDSSWSLELPGLPFQLKVRDLPSFLTPSNPYTFALPAMEEQFEDLDRQTNPKILVNTFDALEPDALRSIEKFNLVGIGPLLPSALLDGGDPSDKCFGVDLFRRSKDYVKWLDGQPESRVVYVSFGSISLLSKVQMEEMARALLESKRPFLWVIRKEEGKEEEKPSCMEELEERGLIVPWCGQVEVLSHPAIGCFVTHCGWNSTMESLATGVPVVAFPQWTDQTTNAKMIEDLWKTGVRVKVNEEGIVESGEIKRCLEIVMESEEMNRNAKKWRLLAIEAAKDGGSSGRNLREFVKEVSGDGCMWKDAL